MREEYIVNLAYSECNHAVVMVAKWEGPWWVSEKRGGITLYKLLVIKQSQGCKYSMGNIVSNTGVTICSIR